MTTPKSAAVLLREWQTRNGYTKAMAAQALRIGTRQFERFRAGTWPSLLTAGLIAIYTDNEVPVESWFWQPKRHMLWAAHGRKAYADRLSVVRKHRWESQKKGWAALKIVTDKAFDRYGIKRVNRAEWKTMTQPRQRPVPPSTDDKEPTDE